MIEGWMILELMGHVKHVGPVSEVEAFGTKLGRIDSLQRDGTVVTSYFGGASVYRATPVTEETAREMMKPYAAHAYSLEAPEGQSEFEDDEDLL